MEEGTQVIVILIIKFSFKYLELHVFCKNHRRAGVAPTAVSSSVKGSQSPSIGESRRGRESERLFVFRAVAPKQPGCPCVRSCREANWRWPSRGRGQLESRPFTPWLFPEGPRVPKAPPTARPAHGQVPRRVFSPPRQFTLRFPAGPSPPPPSTIFSLFLFYIPSFSAMPLPQTPLPPMSEQRAGGKALEQRPCAQEGPATIQGGKGPQQLWS